MAMDGVFNFAVVNSFLSTFPPGLTKQTEDFVKVHGFDSLLVAMFQSEQARRLIQEAFHKALIEAKFNGSRLNSTREKILSKVSLGIRTGPDLKG